MSNGKDKHFWDETRKPWMDLENERKPIKPQKSGKTSNKANETTGVANQQMAGFFQDMVMEKAMNDRLAQFARVDTPEVQGVPEISLVDSNAQGDEAETKVEEVEEEIRGDEDDIELIRLRRMNEMKRIAQLQGKFLGLGHGQYTEITETEFLHAVIKSPRCVVHFYHKEFARCKVVDQRFSEVAPFVMGCRFLKIDAEKCPFFVTKLQVKVLPTILYFVDGKTVHRVTGFTEYGGNENFTGAALVRSLQRHKMLKDSDESQWRTFMPNKDESEEEND